MTNIPTSRSIEQKSRKLVALFFIILTLVGLIAGARYSFSCDETAEYLILKSNLAEYTMRILGTDNAIYARLGDDIDPISQNKERDHGVSAYYAASPVFLLMRQISRYALMQAWHIWTFLLFMLGVYALYALARELLRMPRALACAAALLLYLSPRMFAEGHYNNKDVVLLTLVLMTIYLGARMITRDRLRDAILFSIAGAFAANTKIIGALFWGALGITYLVLRVARGEMNKGTWTRGLCAIFVFLGAYALLTPAMWADPIGFIRYLLDNATGFSRWKMYLMFEGELVFPLRGEVPPWNYLPRIMLMTTPLTVIALTFAGLSATVYKFTRIKSLDARERDAIWILLAVIICCAAPLMIGMFSGAIVYNGWRHFYFTYSGAMLLCACALKCIYNLLKERKRALRLCAGALAAYFCAQGAFIAVNHPLQACYYNVIAAPRVNGNYETDYWLLSLGEAAVQLGKSEKRDKTLEPTYTVLSFLCPATELVADTLPPTDAIFTKNVNEANYFIEIEMYETIKNKIPLDEYDDFISKYTQKFTQEELDSHSRDWNARGEFEELFKLTSYGIEIATVYQRTHNP